MKEIRLNREQIVVWRNPKSIFRYNGWPTVCSDERGVLYAAASSFRIQHVDPSGKNAMFVSFNGGETWTKPIIVNDSYIDDRDTGIVSLGDGHMIMSWFSSRHSNNCREHAKFEWEKEHDKKMILSMGEIWDILPQDELKSGAYVKLSDDYGVTWSENIPVPMTAPHGPNKMSGNRAIYLGKDMFPDESGESKIYAYISSDYGATWNKVGAIPLPEGHEWWMLHEPHVAELPNGRLMGAIRCHGRPTEPGESTYITFSDDEGKTWTEPKFIGIAGLPPHILVHSSGAVILSYACRDGDTKSERAFVSYDNGETWAEDYVLSFDPPFNDLGYPATAECADGSLFTIYYQVYPGDDCCSLMGVKWKLGDKE